VRVPCQEADELLTGVPRRARHPDPHPIPFLHNVHSVCNRADNYTV
jgi:hypothetical protein